MPVDNYVVAACNVVDEMGVSNNRLDGHIPPELSRLESLTLLDLQNNSLTDGLPEFVKGMPTLQDLLFSSNPLLGEAP
ncbi:hypothetical protein ZWY2020_023032 [Hordeum vulgare]|nr:hypothetical protein ZWY2020_023032 [Hordeum vulgare]